MKKEFPEFYQLTDKQLASIGKRAVIAFDASFLLDLYRYSPGVAEKMFSVLEGLGQQVWLPHRAAYEFHNNRLNVLETLRSKHAKVMEHLNADGKKLMEQIENACRMHPLLEVGTIVEPIRKSLEKAGVHLSSITDKHAKATLSIEDDAIWKRAVQIFGGKIGPEFTDEDLKTVEQEAKKRFERKVPPGYEDAKKDYPFGDFILWKQLLDHCKTQNLPGFFITSDVKHDWWLTSQRRKLGPRPELRKEFLRYTGQEFHLYETTHFVEVYAPKFQVAPEEPIKEINKIQKDRLNDRSLTEKWWEATGALGALRIDSEFEQQQIERARLLGISNPLVGRDSSALLEHGSYHPFYGNRKAHDTAERMLYEQMNPPKNFIDASNFLHQHLGDDDFGIPGNRPNELKKKGIG
jgi:hypothetical protein